MIKQMDAKTWLESLQPGSVKLVIADPPYGIGYKSSGGTRIPKRYDRTDKEALEPRKMEESFGEDVFDAKWLPAAAQAMATDSAMFLFTRWDVCHLWKQAIEDAGLKVVQRIVWDKALWGAGDLAYYGSQTEDILFCIKGRPKMQWAKRSGNVWKVGKGRITGKDGARHPTQKPVDLQMRMIMDTTKPDDFVAVPFAGSGSGVVAGLLANRKAEGCDTDPRYVVIGNTWVLDATRTDPRISMKILI